MAKQSFESALKQLEKIVSELEAGELPLERALKKFEEGMRLAAFCSQKLEETETRISLLLKAPDGSISEQPFESDDS